MHEVIHKGAVRRARHVRPGAALRGAPQSVKCIAERQGIPEAYLEQLIAPLRKAGLVLSIRGAQGGYILAKEPAAISVGAILRRWRGRSPRPSAS